MFSSAGASIGIDLGTYNSVATVSLGGVPILLRSREGQTDQGVCFPSFVEFDADGTVKRVGADARQSLSVNPEFVVWGVKRLIGKSYDEVKKSGDLDRFQYRVGKGRDGSCRIIVGNKEYSPTEVSSFVLQKIKEDAEADFNQINAPVTEASVTVPAFFSPFQRAETERAARLAGFEVVRLIPEPTAAALAYKLQMAQETEIIVVTDIGAGTFDVTIALMYQDKNGLIQTAEKSHGGNTALGGLDIDDALFKYVVSRFGVKDVVRDSHGQARLRAELEQAKITLSDAQRTTVAFDVGQRKVEFELTRQDVETATEPVIRRCEGPIDVALREAGLATGDVAHVLLIGGPTKMPIYQHVLAQKFYDNPQVARDLAAIEHDGFPVNPMEAVGLGAVLGSFGGITPHSYGVVLDGNYFELIPRRTRYPCTNTASTPVSGRKRSMSLQLLQQEVDPANFQEVFSLLGVFQFDYRPEEDGYAEVEAVYTENGLLNLKIVQPSSRIELPLYGVSKLEGRRVARPRTPLPTGTPTYTGGEGGIPGAVPSEPPPAKWTQQDLQTAIRAANRLRGIALARMAEAAPEDRRNLEQLLSALDEQIGNVSEDVSTRTPQLRNLNRALVISLLAGHLISPAEARELLKEADPR